MLSESKPKSNNSYKIKLHVTPFHETKTKLGGDFRPEWICKL